LTKPSCAFAGSVAPTVDTGELIAEVETLGHDSTVAAFETLTFAGTDVVFFDASGCLRFLPLSFLESTFPLCIDSDEPVISISDPFARGKFNLPQTCTSSALALDNQGP
jgi:hypothetical protein